MEPELSDVLLVVADRLGVAAEAVFTIFVGAQPVIGVVTILSNVLGVLAALYTAKRLHMYLCAVCKDEDGDWTDNEYSFWEPVALLVVVCLGLFVFIELFTGFGECVLRIIVPEYMATREIIGILKP